MVNLEIAKRHIKKINSIFKYTDEYVKSKNSIEDSFNIWISQYPDSLNHKDNERFLKFVRNVCIFHSKKWKDTEYLEKRINEKKPNFDKDKLESFMFVYEFLIDFYEVLKRGKC